MLENSPRKDPHYEPIRKLCKKMHLSFISMPTEMTSLFHIQQKVIFGDLKFEMFRSLGLYKVGEIQDFLGTKYAGTYGPEIKFRNQIV
jgi:hypothetical protein